ncbi:DUF4907 domain-containing protein [Flavobacterium cupreum]|uniref:DUF4907 domain-containing protein n=3 Tax=Flavobacteriaceae TaxID=49546 RepID=A0A4Y7U636_9FLAO|nr:DUF4907 domain-containing protein [Flavobacterium cupreum]TEB41242.1 DUF4907 domain-containing protein [Flavobacterium circumlabens]
MTITNTKIFFRYLRKNILFIFLVLQLTACTKSNKLKTEAFKTTSGWGYTIAYKNKIIIRQSVIPVINDSKSFSTEEDALKVGNLVENKLSHNRSPTVTKNDLILLKIKF